MAYLLLVTGLLYAYFGDWAYDDPFITYRYARNLLAGNGFVYNPGEYILSTTTPLFALLLALLGNLWGNLPRLANLIGASSLALGALFTWDLAQRWKSPLVGWAALVLYPTFPLLVTTLGSETPLYLALCLLAIVFYARGKYLWVGVFAALAVLARPDASLIVFPQGAHYLLSNRSRLRIGQNDRTLRDVLSVVPWGALGWSAAILLGWATLSWWYFGSPVPATLAAKQSQGSLAISQGFAAGLVTTFRPYLHYWQYWVTGLLSFLGCFYLFLRARRWLIVLVWTASYFLAYWLLGVSRYFWYYAPLIPGLIVLVGLGLTALTRIGLPGFVRRVQRDSESELLGQNWGKVSSVVLLVIMGVFQITSLAQLRLSPDARYKIYRDIGQWLAENTPESASVGALEIGIVGYYAQREMIDFAGLLQPAVAEHLTGAQDYAAAAEWAVNEYHPDYVVLHDGLFPNLESGYLTDQCGLAERFSGEPYGFGGDMLIYTCN